MNEGKELHLNTHGYIHFLAFLKIGFKIPYRTVQGIVRGLSDQDRRNACDNLHNTTL
jgi:hypothetical protein